MIPPSFLFQYSMAVPRIDNIPQKKGSLLQLADATRLFVPGSLNAAGNHLTLKLAWNPEGLGLEFTVRGKKRTPSGRQSDLRTSDFVEVWLDTRHTANVHRATEYCAALFVLPCDDNADDNSTVTFREIAQQRTSKRDQDGRKCKSQTTLISGGYTLELWIPKSQLHGFDEAAEIGHIGFYCVIHDTEIGEIPLSVGDDFPVSFDPSTWLQLELKA